MTKKRIVNTTSKDINDIEENINDAKYNDEVKELLRLQTKRLNELLEERQIPQDEFAKKVGIASGTLSNYCSGKVLIKSEFLPKIAKVLNVSTDYLLGVSGVKKYTNNELNKKFGLNDNSIENLELALPKDSINEIFDRNFDSVCYLFEVIEEYKKENKKLSILSNKVHNDKNNKLLKADYVMEKNNLKITKFRLQEAFIDLINEKIVK